MALSKHMAAHKRTEHWDYSKGNLNPPSPTLSYENMFNEYMFNDLRADTDINDFTRFVLEAGPSQPP
jgi:hypothetical protein